MIVEIINPTTSIDLKCVNPAHIHTRTQIHLQMHNTGPSSLPIFSSLPRCATPFDISICFQTIVSEVLTDSEVFTASQMSPVSLVFTVSCSPTSTRLVSHFRC